MGLFESKTFRTIVIAAIAATVLVSTIFYNSEETHVEHTVSNDDSKDTSIDVSEHSTKESISPTYRVSDIPTAVHYTQPVSLEQLMRRDSEGLEIKVHPAGHESLSLNGRYSHVSVAVVDADGDIQVQCFSGYEALEGALNGSAPVTVSKTNKKEGIRY